MGACGSKPKSKNISSRRGGSKRSSGTHNANNGADVAGGGAPAPSYTAVGVAADEPEAPKLESKDFSRQLCEEINKLRATHGSPPLVYDADLSEGANVWAKHLANQAKLQPTSDSTVGETLAWKPRGVMSPQQAARIWHEEIKYYNWKRPGFTGATANFTQVVWKNTTNFGGAIAYDEAGAPYAVGRYSPPGNLKMIGQFDENVPRVPGTENDDTKKKKKKHK